MITSERRTTALPRGTWNEHTLLDVPLPISRLSPSTSPSPTRISPRCSGPPTAPSASPPPLRTRLSASHPGTTGQRRLLLRRASARRASFYGFSGFCRTTAGGAIGSPVVKQRMASDVSTRVFEAAYTGHA